MPSEPIGKERCMRFMLTFRIPMETGNKMIKDGSLPETIQTILEDLKPEAAYFSDIEGARGGYLVINMDEASQMPALSEPLFLGLGATIQAHPVMVPEDLEKAGADLQQVAQKYG